MLNATKIAWFSRHSPTPRQRETLEQLFGSSVEILVDTRRFAGASQVAERFLESGASELFIVAPLTILYHLIRLGVYPIRAVMERCPGSHPEAETKTRHCHYRFIHFERIEAITTTVSILTPKEPSCSQNTL